MELHEKYAVMVVMWFITVVFTTNYKYTFLVKQIYYFTNQLHFFGNCFLAIVRSIPEI
jgi:hypothetical protein